MTTENIEIRTREDGSREVSKRLEALASAADTAAKEVKNFQAALKEDAAKKAAQSQTKLSSAIDSTGEKSRKAANAQRQASRATKEQADTATKAAGVQKRLADSVRNTAQAYTILDGPLGSTAGRLRAISTALTTLNPLLVGAGLIIAGITFGLTKLAAQGQEAELQLARLGGVIKATGGVAGLSVEEINKLSFALARNTLASVEGAREASAVLLTFRSISGPAFEDTLKLAQDLSAVFGQDLKASALQLGKALEDPIRGLTALRRVGVSFEPQVKDAVTLLAQVGEIQAAQRIIRDELRKQVGGAAEAEGVGTLAGAIDTLQENVKELFETINSEFGVTKDLADIFSVIGENVKRVTDFVKDLDVVLSSLDFSSPFEGAIDKLEKIGQTLRLNTFDLQKFAADFERAFPRVTSALASTKSFAKDIAAAFKEVSSSPFLGVPIIGSTVAAASTGASKSADQIRKTNPNLDAGKKARIDAEREAAERQRKAETFAEEQRLSRIKELEDKISIIRITAERERLSALSRIRRRAAQDVSLQVQAEEVAAEQRVNKKLFELDVRQQERLNKARLQSIALGFDVANNVIRKNLDERALLIQQSSIGELELIRKTNREQLNAQLVRFSTEKEALQRSLDAQNEIIRQAEESRKLAQSLSGAEIDPRLQESRVKAEEKRKQLIEEIAGLEERIKAAKSLADTQLLTELEAKRLDTAQKLFNLRLQQQQLLIQEAQQIKSIVDSSRNRVEVLQDQIIKFGELLRSEKALAASGVSSEELQRTLDNLKDKLQDTLNEQNEIMNTFSTGLESGLKGAFSSFLQDTSMGLDGLREKFADVITQMAADAIAANLFGALFGARGPNGERIQGIFGSGGLGDILNGAFREKVGTPGVNPNAPDPKQSLKLVESAITKGAAEGTGQGAQLIADENKTFLGGLGGLFNNLFSSLGPGLGGLLGSAGKGIGGFFSGIFDGKFAHGGVLQANKIGLVGENGPELISSGPQPLRVTPMVTSGGSGNSRSIEAKLDQLIRVMQEKELTVVNVNEQDPEALLAALNTREGVRTQRNRVTLNPRQARRDLGLPP